MRVGGPHGGHLWLKRQSRPCQSLLSKTAAPPHVHWRLLSSTSPRAISEITIDTDEPPYRPRDKPNPHARDVAVLGAGITGLATAFNLSRLLPEAKITVYESKSRPGGWLDSELVPVDGGEVLFEWGPRTLRWDNLGAGRYTTHLMSQLNMTDDILATSRNAAAARNRYVYYPDHLVRMPGPMPGAGIMGPIRNFSTLLNEPVFKGIFRALFREPTIDVRPETAVDESVGKFISRRFGKDIADNLVSALLHGIYAGDLYKLSAKTLLPLLWHLERISDSGIVGELGTLMFQGKNLLPYSDVDLMGKLEVVDPVEDEDVEPVIGKLQGASVYTFKRGLKRLAERLEIALASAPNVDVKTSRHISSIQNADDQGGNLAEDEKIRVIHSPATEDHVEKEKDTQIDVHDHVISTLKPSFLFNELGPNSLPEDLKREVNDRLTFVNVMVVNLFYRNPTLLNTPGFGYLIPRSVALEQNPERALGVIFGSETSAGQDTAPGTKLTVMLGGHWWSTWKREELPDEEEAIRMAKSVLMRHLGVAEEPIVAGAKTAFDAIPQYNVGYARTMARLHDAVYDLYRGRLKVLGSAFHGAVGVHDCVKAARKVALDIREGNDAETGLKQFKEEGSGRWCTFERATGIMKVRKKGVV